MARGDCSWVATRLICETKAAVEEGKLQ